MFKKIIIVLILGITVLIPSVSFAKVNIGWKMIGYKTGLSQKKDYNDIYKIANNVVNLVLSLTSIIFFAIMMYGGLRWLTAQGEDDKIQTAQVAIKAGVIGFVVVVSSYAISNYVFKFMVYSSGGQTVNCSATTSKDGDKCGDNSICKNKSCIPECLVAGLYMDSNKFSVACMDSNKCNNKGGKTYKGYCPGGASNICCVIKK